MSEAEYWNKSSRKWQSEPEDTPWYRQWTKVMQLRSDTSELRSIIRRYKDLRDKHPELSVDFTKNIEYLQGKIDAEQEILHSMC